MPTLIDEINAALRKPVNDLRTEVVGPTATVPVVLPDLAATVQTLAAAVNHSTTGLTATKAVADAAKGVADAALPTAGGTMTGPLNVQTPATATNPLQLSSLPTSMTINQPLPLIALGGTHSFTVTVPNAQVGQVVVLNVPATLLTSLAFFDATVTAANTVTIYLKAGLAIAAGTQTFYLRVLR